MKSYVIVDNKGVEWSTQGADKRTAIARAEQFDNGYPDRAPHKVYEITRKQVKP